MPKTIQHIRRAVITGGLGLIGSTLAQRLLDGGAHVLVLDNFLFGRRQDILKPQSRLQVKKMDIRDGAKLTAALRKFKPDIVFHLAAIAFIPRCIQEPQEALATHIGGTENVVEAIRVLGIKRAFFSSTADVYTVRQKILSENSPVAPPPDVYGITKYVGEVMFELLQRRTKSSVTVARFFNVYGPHPTNIFFIPALHRQLEAGKNTLRLGNLNTVRDYIHVSDVVEAVLQLVASNKNEYLLANVGSGKSYSARQVIHLFELALNKKLTVIQDKKFMRPVDRKAWQADINKITARTGWTPKVPLRDGLADLVRNSQ